MLEGFLNLAGTAVPVVDAAKLFNLRPSEMDPIYRHIVIVNDGESKLGLLVDRVEDVRRLDREAIRPSEAGQSLNDCVLGEIDASDVVIHVLAADRILLAAEKARLADLSRLEQQRLDGLAAP